MSKLSRFSGASLSRVSSLNTLRMDILYERGLAKHLIKIMSSRDMFSKYVYHYNIYQNSFHGLIENTFPIQLMNIENDVSVVAITR